MNPLEQRPSPTPRKIITKLYLENFSFCSIRKMCGNMIFTENGYFVIIKSHNNQKHRTGQERKIKDIKTKKVDF